MTVTSSEVHSGSLHPVNLHHGTGVTHMKTRASFEHHNSLTTDEALGLIADMNLTRAAYSTCNKRMAASSIQTSQRSVQLHVSTAFAVNRQPFCRASVGTGAAAVVTEAYSDPKTFNYTTLRCIYILHLFAAIRLWKLQSGAGSMLGKIGTLATVARQKYCQANVHHRFSESTYKN